MKPDIHYQILEVEVGASLTEIKQAYRDLVLVWHPDRFFDNPRLREKAEEKIKRINAAYEFLKSYQTEHHQSNRKNENEPTQARQKTESQKSTAQSNVNPKQQRPVEIPIKCENLKKLLQLGKLQDADFETKRLLLELVSREKDGWLRPEDVKRLPLQTLLAIDQLWSQHSNGRFGFNTQAQIWQTLGCESSNSMSVQTLSENKFGQAVDWRVGSTWLSPWDGFDYTIQAPLGSLPRAYIFALSGWWSYSQGWVGYLIWRFDEIFLKL